jgi:hypothetical protein
MVSIELAPSTRTQEMVWRCYRGWRRVSRDGCTDGRRYVLPEPPSKRRQSSVAAQIKRRVAAFAQSPVERLRRRLSCASQSHGVQSNHYDVARGHMSLLSNVMLNDDLFMMRGVYSANAVTLYSRETLLFCLWCPRPRDICSLCSVLPSPTAS